MDRQYRITSSTEETLSLGQELGEKAKEGAIFALIGELGSGKTQLVKGIASGYLSYDVEITSPTFSYVHFHKSDNKKKLYHFDLYRIKHSSEFIDLGLLDLFSEKGIFCIEWPEMIVPFFERDNFIVIECSFLSFKKRKFFFKKK